MEDIKLTMEELEFFSENEKIKIQPLYRIDKIELITGTYGPFNPLRNTTVPLWLAILLVRANRCRIICPSWLAAEYLERLILQEKSPNSKFSVLPENYLLIAKILFEYAENDITNSQLVRRRLQDLVEIRHSKIGLGLQVLNPVQLQMDNLSTAEINSIKPIFKPGFDQLFSLSSVKNQN
ncbi:DNA replication complex GINS protein PSF2 [Smittium culicis]|uniref:DNA replication complex GINS protein PSF2 n=1 Tax=Smittium culicis TaxID=133412 RepID=A0A1R1XKQ9_9FUNG|nr:DNA replication complex GINS protein PSF2 [Smittium culicis]